MFFCLGKSADFPLKGSKGILKCRALEAARAVGAPCGFVAYLAVDHQMTPTLFTGLFALRAFAPLTGGSAVGIRFADPPT